MYNDMCELKRLLYVILLIKDKINEGDIAKSVNVAIEPLNRKYNMNFKCQSDEEFIVILTNFINFIDNRVKQEIIRKIEEEISKDIFE